MQSLGCLPNGGRELCLAFTQQVAVRRRRVLGPALVATALLARNAWLEWLVLDTWVAAVYPFARRERCGRCRVASGRVVAAGDGRDREQQARFGVTLIAAGAFLFSLDTVTKLLCSAPAAAFCDRQAVGGVRFGSRTRI